MFVAGVRAVLSASRFAAFADAIPKAGTDYQYQRVGSRNRFLMNVFYDVAKGAINRAIYGICGMVRELRPHNIAAIALASGFMRTERVALAFESAESLRIGPRMDTDQIKSIQEFDFLSVSICVHPWPIRFSFSTDEDTIRPSRSR
jgi:NAD(P)-dependent dehydrogenase (short-subunit alcohol dehydrogenase family)